MRDPGQSVGFLVNEIARLLRRNFNRRVQELGLSQSQWRALAYLAHQEGVNQATLAESLEIQPITLARLIDRLEDAGLVARRPDPADRRAFRLYLTEDSEPLLERMWSFAAESREEAMAGLPKDARDRLIGTLSAMKQNLLDAEARACAASERVTKEAENAEEKV